MCNHSAEYLGIADKVWFPEYRRRKRAEKDANGNTRRTNAWVAINAHEAPKGVHIASQTETKCFPHVTFDRLGLSEARYGS